MAFSLMSIRPNAGPELATPTRPNATITAAAAYSFHIASPRASIGRSTRPACDGLYVGYFPTSRTLCGKISHIGICFRRDGQKRRRNADDGAAGPGPGAAPPAAPAGEAAGGARRHLYDARRPAEAGVRRGRRARFRPRRQAADGQPGEPALGRAPQGRAQAARRV